MTRPASHPAAARSGGPPPPAADAPPPGTSPLLPARHRLPPLRLDHLRRLTDGTGLIQHAVYSIPRYEDGYATDDNVRAVLLLALLGERLGTLPPDCLDLGARYLAFMHHAFNSDRHRFRNFMSYERSWLEEVGSEDSHGRGVHVLGAVAARWLDPSTRQWAAQLFLLAIDPVVSFTSPRAWAFALLGITEHRKFHATDEHVRGIAGDLADRLAALFAKMRTEEWGWLETDLTYCNAKIPHALIAAGASLDRPDLVQLGLETLDWLSGVQRGEDGQFVPIGSDGFYRRDGARARYDQQPIEAHATVSACLEAHRHTGASRWLEEAWRAFEWFTGRNDLGEPICDPDTGACHDGLEAGGRNQNRGAESTLAFLLARTEMEAASGAEQECDLWNQ